MTHVHLVTASWSEVSARSMTDDGFHVEPGGSSGVSRPGRPPGRPRPSGSRKSTSRYSPSDSWPVDRASPKCTFGRGEKPSVLATGSSARRRARSQQPGHVAVAGEADLAELGEAEPDPHRDRPPAPTAAGSARPSEAPTGTALWPARSWPVPWVPPAGGVAEATMCSMRVAGAGAAVVAGGPAAVLEADLVEGVAPVLPEEVLVETGREVVPGQDLVLGAVAVDVPVERRGRGWPWPRPTGRGRSARDHSWNVPPRRQTSSMTGPRRRSPRLTRPSTRVAFGSCHLSCTPWSRRASSRSRLILRLQLRDGVLAEPLERRERLGHEAADRHRDRRALGVVPCPISTQLRASSAMPRVSSSVSVGRPVRK